MAKKRPWLIPDTSYVGASIMIAGILLTLFVGYTFFSLSYTTASLVAAFVGVVTGIVFNSIAHYRGTKKIHWLDLLFISLPW